MAQTYAARGRMGWAWLAMAALLAQPSCGSSTEASDADATGGTGGAGAMSGGPGGDCPEAPPDTDGCPYDGLVCNYADRGDGCPTAYSCTAQLGSLAWVTRGPDDGEACSDEARECSYSEASGGDCPQTRVAECDGARWLVELEETAACGSSSGAGGEDDGRGGAGGR